MQYLHTLIRVSDPEQYFHFYSELPGLREINRRERGKGRFTLVFLAVPEDEDRACRGNPGPAWKIPEAGRAQRKRRCSLTVT
jgi:catechol 2,3-dioxygenase-like lactoylglutathione lyase family enzyme